MRVRHVAFGMTLASGLLIGAAQWAGACSQCLCGSPTPPGQMLGEFTSRWSYGLEDRYLSKTNVLQDADGDEHQVEHRIAGLLVYRPGPRATFQARLPYVFKSNTERAVGEPEEMTRSNGIGDAEVMARFDVLRSGGLLAHRGTLALVAATAIPTGSNDAHDAAGDRFEAHLQPGTGAWSGTAGVAGSLSLASSALSASVLRRVNGTSDLAYHYGDVVLFNLGYARTLSPRWEGALELNGRSAERDRTEEGEDDPNSGGTLLYAAPSVRWSGIGAVAIDLLVQIPVAQSLNGVQNEHTTGRLALVWAHH